MITLVHGMQGKFGDELLQHARHERAGKEYACTNKELLFKHGNKAQPATGYFCSLNELTMGESTNSFGGFSMNIPAFQTRQTHVNSCWLCLAALP